MYITNSTALYYNLVSAKFLLGILMTCAVIPELVFWCHLSETDSRLFSQGVINVINVICLRSFCFFRLWLEGYVYLSIHFTSITAQHDKKWLTTKKGWDTCSLCHWNCEDNDALSLLSIEWNFACRVSHSPATQSFKSILQPTPCLETQDALIV